jgi:polyisoprenoid-binding protein YceI
MKRLFPLLAPLALFVFGCDPATKSSPSAPPPVPSPSDDNGLKFAVVGSGGKIDLKSENMSIEFVGTKKDGQHKGGFKGISGSATLVAPAPGAQRTSKLTRLNVEIQTDSLFSDDPKLTTHLKSKDFFDVNKHAKATFEVTKVELTDLKETHEEVKITGDLTLLGVTKPITATGTLTSDKGLLHLNASFELSRKEFGMNYGEGKVDDNVKVTVVIGRKK